MEQIIVLLAIVAVAVGVYLWSGAREAKLLNERRNLRKNGHYSTNDDDHLIF